MIFRIATLNLEQNHKCWPLRRELIVHQLRDLSPDMLALNEICIPEQTGRWLQQAATERLGIKYNLYQQSKAGTDGHMQGEGLLARYPAIETANRDYGSHDCVGLVARFQFAERILDVYVTHLIAARVDESARLYQVGQLLEWIHTRHGADGTVVCGDFNAAPEQPSIQLMMSESFHSCQFAPTAFTPLHEPQGDPTHPEWPRFDRCIDYIWVKGKIKVKNAGLCFDKPTADNPDLWPSDHVGVCADLELL